MAEHEKTEVTFKVVNERLDNFVIQLAIACADLQKTDEMVKFYTTKKDEIDRFGLLFAIRMQVQVLRSMLMIIMLEDEDGIIPDLMPKAPVPTHSGQLFYV